MAVVWRDLVNCRPTGEITVRRTNNRSLSVRYLVYKYITSGPTTRCLRRISSLLSSRPGCISRYIPKTESNLDEGIYIIKFEPNWTTSSWVDIRKIKISRWIYYRHHAISKVSNALIMCKRFWRALSIFYLSFQWNLYELQGHQKPWIIQKAKKSGFIRKL